MAIDIKVAQLDRNIQDFRAGELFPDMPRKQDFRVFPVIVSPAEWPRIYTLGARLPELLPSTGLLKGCEPLELLDVGEVEQLEAIASAGHSITGLLDRKNSFIAHNRFQSLHNYLIHSERSMLQEASPALQYGNDVARRAIELALTWS